MFPDSDDQPGVSQELVGLGLEYLKAKAATVAAKNEEKEAFAVVVLRMRKVHLHRFWLQPEGGQRQWISIKPGPDRLKVEKVKLVKDRPESGRAKRSKKDHQADSSSTASRGGSSNGNSGDLPADVRLWSVDHLGTNLLLSHVGQDAFEAAANACLPIGLTPSQVAKVSEKMNAETIGTLEAFMASEPLRWWQTMSKNAGEPIVTRVVESLGALRRVHKHAE